MYKVVNETGDIAKIIFYGGKLDCFNKIKALYKEALLSGYRSLPLFEDYILIGASVIYTTEVSIKEEMDKIKQFSNWGHNVSNWEKTTTKSKYLLQRNKNNDGLIKR